jgi:hypothetical protein
MSKMLQKSFTTTTIYYSTSHLILKVLYAIIEFAATSYFIVRLGSIMNIKQKWTSHRFQTPPATQT